jgi:hypothetical protein
VDNVPIRKVGSIGLQYISPEDWGYMQGFHHRHNGVRSMPVEVYCFELYMQDARPTSSPSCPCMTYIREDDTVKSLTERISIVTGESDWESVRLAVVCTKRLPHYLSRDSLEAMDSSNDVNRYVISKIKIE